MTGNKMALVIGLICALIASLMVSKVINQNAKSKIATIAKTTVVFAKTEIPGRTIITADQLELRSIPKEAVGLNSIQKLDQVVGMVTKSDILVGEQVNLNRLLKQGEGVSLAFLIPNGMRALTIAVNEVIGVAGFVKPGERVDIIGTMEPKESQNGSVTWTVLQDVEVLAVSQEMNATVKESKKDNKNNDPKLGTSVTLAVTPFQAQKVALAEEKGVLRLTLRPALKELNVTVAPVRESSLIPSSTGGGGFKAPVTTITSVKPRRQIEVISGNKTVIVTVD